MSDGGRPQDQGRRHRRGGNPSPETTSLLARWHEAMRTRLSSLLDELAGTVPDPGLHLLDEAIERGDIAARIPLPLKEELPRWDLAIKLGRELGTEVDPAPPVGPAAGPPSPIRRRSRSKIDFGPG